MKKIKIFLMICLFQASIFANAAALNCENFQTVAIHYTNAGNSLTETNLENGIKVTASRERSFSMYIYRLNIEQNGQILGGTSVSLPDQLGTTGDSLDDQFTGLSLVAIDKQGKKIFCSYSLFDK